MNTIDNMREAMRRLLITVIIICLSGANAGCIYGQQSQQKGKQRLKVGLVLGGGGAKGAAEVGVLKVIEEVGIPIDYIAGTSIGAINGGLYSLGYDAAGLDSLFRNQDWLKLFTKGSILDMLIEKTGITDSISFDDMPIPFRCVAVDTKTQQEIVLSSGCPAVAMRASMAIPGAFKPVKIDTLVLVDGGMLNNLPVDVVKAMGADVVIAVDLTQNKREARDKKMFGVTKLGKLISWTIARPDLKKYNENVVDVDVYINPDLDGYKAMSFKKKKIAEMIDIGYETGDECRDELLQLKEMVMQGKR